MIRCTTPALAVWIPLLLACGCASTGPSTTQAPHAAPPAYAPAPEAPAGLASAEELETLVAPVALYPDPLLALVLPASTQPLQIVQAARFLDARARDASLQPDPKWDPALQSLLNYPDVVKKMSDDLGWTERLGNAVYDQQQDVIDAIQSVRTKANAAGTLRSDDKQTVATQDGVVTVVPANDQLIYVPTYDPQVIYVPQPAAPVVVYSEPYPSYWAPAAVFATGVALGFALDWYHHDIWYGPHGWHGGDVEINRSGTINRSTNVNRPAAPAPPSQPARPGAPGGGGSWKPGNRPGGPPARPSTLPSGRPGAGGGARPSQLPGARPSQLPATRPGDRPSTGLSSGRFGTYERGSEAARDRSRGAASRAGSSANFPSRGSIGGAGGGSRGGAGMSRGGAGGMSRGGGGMSRGGGGMSRGGGGRGGGRR